jgi:peptide/nickel transport system substrate-binding protein
MKRRRFIAASAAALALPSLARGEKGSVLKFVPIGDPPTLDPIWTGSYDARLHGFMVFDTLYGQAGSEQGWSAKPQMVAGHTIENDGKTWTLTLRDGLVFHDGTKVLARDCVASIRRWSVRDVFGQTLMQRTDELSAPDDRTIVFRLKKPLVVLPDALGKFAPMMCAIMPERLANTDPFKQIPEIIGSGPFRFKPDEHVAGSLYVYERFNEYKPREDGQPSFISGPKVVHFDRVEWHINPDQTTVIAALQAGELDWDEYVMNDMVPMLRRDSRITVQRVGSSGYWGYLQPNWLFPPFDNPAIRRALMGAIDQTEFMTAALGDDPSRWVVPTGYFPPASPMVSDVGLTALAGPRDLDKVRRDLLAAGYRGEKVVLISASNLWTLKAFSDVTADMLRKVGMDVDEQVMDSATWIKRIFSNKKPPDQGGWNLYGAALQGTEALSPACHKLLAGGPGWPSSDKITALRDQWLDAQDIPTQRKLAAEIQAQAFVDVPYYPLGTWFPATAFRSNLTGALDGQGLFWNVRRQG